MKSQQNKEPQKNATSDDERPSENEESQSFVVSLHLLNQLFKGLNPSLLELKATFAVLKLLDQTNYKGEDRKQVMSEGFKYEGIIPILRVTEAQYLDAFGVNKFRTSRGFTEFSGWERKRAVEALEKLASRKFRFRYRRKNWKKGSERFENIDCEDKLLKVRIIREKSGRKYLQVKPAPIICDQVKTFYARIPSTLFEEIRRIKRGKYSRNIPLFIIWLLKCGKKQHPICLKTLARELGMNLLIKCRKKKVIRSIIEDCIRVAEQLHFLDGHQWTESKAGEPMVVLSLNRERCCRLSIHRKKRKKKPDSLPQKVAGSTTKHRKLYHKKSQAQFRTSYSTKS
jgi:hypothetical protein